MMANEKKLENKHKRLANFTVEEEQVLINLVTERKEIIECKKTDCVTWKQKNAVWEWIAQKFNTTSGRVYRDSKNLRNKYENMKKITRKKYANERSYSLGTGGGQEHVSTVTSLDEQIKDLLGNQINGIQSEFDSDSNTNQTNVTLAEASVELIETNELDETNVLAETIVMDGSVCSETIEIPYRAPDNIKDNTNNSWSDYTPAMLQQKRSRPLLVSLHEKNSEPADNTEDTTYPASPSPMRKAVKRKRLNRSSSDVNKWNELADSKQQLVMLQLNVVKKEHEIKMKQMIEEHELKMELIKLKIAMMKNELKL